MAVGHGAAKHHGAERDEQQMDCGVGGKTGWELDGDAVRVRISAELDTAGKHRSNWLDQLDVAGLGTGSGVVLRGTARGLDRVRGVVLGVGHVDAMHDDERRRQQLAAVAVGGAGIRHLHSFGDRGRAAADRK